jgi:hypothetical protein
MAKHDGKRRLLVGKAEADDRDGEVGVADLQTICFALRRVAMTQMLPVSTNDGL